METGQPDGDRHESLSAISGDSAVLTVVDEFENIYDVPFITVNRIGFGCYVAEVVLSGDDETDLDRIQTALDVATVQGVHAYARVHGEFDTTLIYFTPDLMGALP